ncbi:methyltransferase [Pseudoalteromonas neustonica]|uniref:tRNA1(Val) (adenine(37)-N6)-methyltransferase n=1 Tax=Pseudoalteromonas neustonica TaxID=1840331 RepID=A0ABU9U7E0_9GAMM
MSGFVFKQFSVSHEQCAMKVSTDGILLGAWADLTSGDSLLDIGAGTGLLALMCKQRAPHLLVNAVEIDATAYAQASQNISQSPWPDIVIYNSDIQSFTSEVLFDVVVCNPPYFNDCLKGGDHARNTARHTDSLSFAELLVAFDRLSHQDSIFNVILPCNEAQQFIGQATAQGLYLQRHCLVRTTKNKSATRSLMSFGYQPRMCEPSILTIHNEDGKYSDDYVALCKDFYLKM